MSNIPLHATMKPKDITEDMLNFHRRMMREHAQKILFYKREKKRREIREAAQGPLKG